MKRARWSLVGMTAALAILAAAPRAAAKRTGMNLPCHNCHEGQDKHKVSAMLSATRVEPGMPVTITVTANHERAKVGGVLVDSKGLGAFEIVDTVGTRLFDNTTTQATHAMPHAYANKQVQFTFRWVAPTTPGAAELEVWSNAANDNLKPEDDSAGEVIVGVSYGCDGVWYYPDADKDGHGDKKSGIFSCTPVPDRITQGGDCDDFNPMRNPAIAELCNSIDDDCDGQSDNGFTPVLLVQDADGDGYGSTTGMSMIGCPPLANYAPSFDDCNDTDPSVHPGAPEAVNQRDDNCNGQRDETTAGTAGGPGTNPGGPTTPAPAPAGCAAAPAAAGNAGLSAWPWFGGVLLFGWARARRASRPTTARRRG